MVPSPSPATCSFSGRNSWTFGVHLALVAKGTTKKPCGELKVEILKPTDKKMKKCQVR